MKHSVAVRTDEGQVSQRRPAFRLCGQRHIVVALDEAGAKIAIDESEIEPADLADKATGLLQALIAFPVGQLAVALAANMHPVEKAPFKRPLLPVLLHPEHWVSGLKEAANGAGQGDELFAAR
jgi:ribosomal protein L25 (general stress protein Ctc)